MPLEGVQLGKYRLVRLIGSGGMGDVYLGEDAHLNRQVAIKVVRSEEATYSNEQASEEAARLFQREMRAIAQLDHPHILPLYDYGEEKLHTTTLVYMVMPFRHDGSLADWLRQRGLSEPLALQDAANLVSQATDALQHAHDLSIIHQDVKPSNFLIRRKKAVPQIPELFLADFGIAKISSMTSSMSHSSRGTPTYMAPEQWNGEPVSATDQYALATMAYELLTGQTPFRGRPEQLMYQHFHTLPAAPSSLRPDLPASLDAVLLRALAKKPDQRFASIAEFASAFDEALAGHGDLFATLTISEGEAARGTQRELRLPGGREAQITVPQGAKDGQRLRFEGQGDPYYTGGPAGDLILALTVFAQDEASQTLAVGSIEPTVLSTSFSQQREKPGENESSASSFVEEPDVAVELAPVALQAEEKLTSQEDKLVTPLPAFPETPKHGVEMPAEKTKASKQGKMLGLKVGLTLVIVLLWFLGNNIVGWNPTTLSISSICGAFVCIVIFFSRTAPTAPS